MACISGSKLPMLPVGAPAPQTNNGNPPKKTFRGEQTASLTDLTPTDHIRIDKNDYPGLKIPAICLGVYMAVASLGFYTVRNQIRGKKTNDLVDALYLSIMTMTTVGFGDLYPHSNVSKILASFFAFVGRAIVGLILSTAGHYLVVKQQAILLKSLKNCPKVGLTDDVLEEIDAENRVRLHKCIVASIIMLVLMLVGAVFLSSIEELDPIDAFYCVCTTVTTVGYGDESFSTGSGRFFAIIWVSTSSTGLAQLFLYIAELFIGKKQKAMFKRIILARKISHVDSKEADIDDDKVVGGADFVMNKLKEMGKISKEDISIAMEGLKDHDHICLLNNQDNAC